MVCGFLWFNTRAISNRAWKLKNLLTQTQLEFATDLRREKTIQSIWKNGVFLLIDRLNIAVLKLISSSRANCKSEKYKYKIDAWHIRRPCWTRNKWREKLMDLKAVNPKIANVCASMTPMLSISTGIFSRFPRCCFQFCFDYVLLFANKEWSIAHTFIIGMRRADD